jgi:ankyrin repeat protein/DNA-binding beta-propeller fold protein YncE
MMFRRTRALPVAAVLVAAFLMFPANAARATPLGDAVAFGDVAAVRDLIAKGADVNAAEKDGVTPLLQAVLSADDEVLAALIEAGAAVNQASAIDGDVLRNHGAQIEPGQRPHVTPLLLAAFLGNRAVVERLLRAKGDVRAAGDDGMQPLHLAAFRASGEIATLLLDSEADVNARDANAATPLHAAAAQGNVPVAAVLLARGAYVNPIDDQGRTPLDYSYGRSDRELVDLLVRRGAVAMQEMLGAKVDVAGTNPRLVPLVDRATLDRIVPAGPRPLGIALDVGGHKVFWTDFAADEIRTCDFDGSGAARLEIPDLSGPIGLAFERSKRSLYWTCDATYPRKVQRAGADGSGVVDVASGRLVNRPSALAADAASGKIFWTESIAGRLRAANLDGSDIQDIVTSGISSEGDRADAREFKALGIAVGPDGKVYWTEMLDAQVLRAAPDGSEVETIIATSAGLELPAGIAVDGGHIYWADAGAAKIQRANLDGSAIEDLLTANDGLIEPYALALDPDGGRLYWSDASAGTINSATLAGKDIRTIVAPHDVAASGAEGDCSRAAMAAGTRYVWKAVNAIGTCLRKVDALKAVWRRQSDGARAAASCVQQFDRLAGPPQGPPKIEAELRARLTEACGTDVAERLRNADGPLRALIERRCATQATRRSGLDCVVASFTDAAYSAVALRFRRPAEWLEEARPFMSAAAGAPAAQLNALANLDRLYAALKAMAEPEHASAPVSSSPGHASTAPVKTGQITSYAALGVGRTTGWTAVADDGAVRSGAPPRYVDNGDGTITDANTGLTWEKKCDGCGGLHDTEASYSLEPAEGGVVSWLAELNAENGTGFAGHADWRLPTIKELVSIVDYERFNPAVSRAFDGDECGLGCDDLARAECSCTGMMWHCSATPFASGTERVFALGFNLGIVGDLQRSDGCAVRAVRSGRGG